MLTEFRPCRLFHCALTQVLLLYKSKLGCSDSAEDCLSAPSAVASQQWLNLIQLRQSSQRSLLASSINVTLEAQTSNMDYAQTETPVLVAFKVDGAWTDDVVFLASAALTQVVVKTFTLQAWPSKLRLTAQGTDAYGYSRLLLSAGSRTVTVLDETMGNKSYGPNSVHWVDGNEDAPRFNVYNVSKLEVESPKEANINCTTKSDSRAYVTGYRTAPDGTSCIFGLDVRDEGSHCIMDDGKYGSFGWCWTSEDMYNWGSCSENCPLFGPAKVLGAKIDRLQEELKENAKASAKKNGTAPGVDERNMSSPARKKAGDASNASNARQHK